MDDKRLIDANELMYIESDANAYSEEWNADYEKGFKDCLDKVMALPTVEAQPVKHGKWIEKVVSRMKWIPYDDDNVNPDDVDIECMTEQKCSYCKRWTIKFTDHIELDYCPLCGAKMDLKEI